MVSRDAMSRRAITTFNGLNREASNLTVDLPIRSRASSTSENMREAVEAESTHGAAATDPALATPIAAASSSSRSKKDGDFQRDVEAEFQRLLQEDRNREAEQTAETRRQAVQAIAGARFRNHQERERRERLRGPRSTDPKISVLEDEVERLRDDIERLRSEIRNDVRGPYEPVIAWHPDGHCVFGGNRESADRRAVGLDGGRVYWGGLNLDDGGEAEARRINPPWLAGWLAGQHMAQVHVEGSDGADGDNTVGRHRNGRSSRHVRQGHSSRRH